MRELPLLIEEDPSDIGPLRIALVTETYPPEINGVAMTLGRMVEGLRHRGHHVQLVRPRQSAADLAAATDTLTQGVPIPSYPGLKLGLPAKRQLVRLWREQRPDLVHVATEGPLGWSAIAAARMLKLPVCSDFHTNFDHYSRHYGFAWLKRPITAYLRKFHNNTDLTLVPTESLRRELIRQGYRRVEVLARGVDTQLFHPQRRSQDLRADWGLAPGALAVMCVGRMAAEKNLPLVVRAFAAIRARLPAARLVFVGDGPERMRLQQAHPGHVYCGMRTGEDLARHYASGDLFLFPSLTETFGNVTLEALASGLCVVAYRHAAAAELILSGDNGLLADPGDESGFIAAAEAAIDAQVLARTRSRAAASIAGHDWERIHEAFARILNESVQTRMRAHHAENAVVFAPDGSS